MWFLFGFSCGFNLFKSSSHIKKFTKIFSYNLLASVIWYQFSCYYYNYNNYFYVRALQNKTYNNRYYFIFANFISHIFNKFSVQQFNIYIIYAYHIISIHIKRLLPLFLSTNFSLVQFLIYFVVSFLFGFLQCTCGHVKGICLVSFVCFFSSFISHRLSFILVFWKN